MRPQMTGTMAACRRGPRRAVGALLSSRSSGPSQRHWCRAPTSFLIAMISKGAPSSVTGQADALISGLRPPSPCQPRLRARSVAMIRCLCAGVVAAGGVVRRQSPRWRSTPGTLADSRREVKGWRLAYVQGSLARDRAQRRTAWRSAPRCVQRQRPGLGMHDATVDVALRLEKSPTAGAPALEVHRDADGSPWM